MPASDGAFGQVTSQMTSYGDPLDTDLLPDALSEALARVIAQKDREWQIQLDAMSAESRATIAELRATIAELSGVARASFEDHSSRVSAVLSGVKNGDPGRDGRDAEPVDMAHIESIIDAKVDQRVAVKVATITVPKDGRDGTDGKDGESVSVETVETMVAGQVAAAFATLPVPQDGHSPTIDELRPAIDETIKRGFEAMPPLKDGKDGAPGIDGKDAEPATREQIVDAIKSVPELFDEAVACHLTANPPKDGRDGTDGKDGDIGPAGKDAEPITKEQIVAAVLDCDGALQEAVVKHLMDNPPPGGRDGLDGTPGDPGRDGRDADPVDYESVHKFIVDRMAEFPVPKDGINGISGKDGVGLTGGLIDRSGSLVLTLSDGTVRDLGCVVGKDADQTLIAKMIQDEAAKLPPPRDGRDGIDGKNVDPVEIKEMVRSELRVLKTEASESESVTIPSHWDGMIDGAHRALSEPLVVRADEPSPPAITLNVTGGGSSPKTISKTIHTRRDEKGNLIADVVESGL